MNSLCKSAIAVIGLTSVLGVVLGSQPVRASQPLSATSREPATIAECARLPLSQRGICKSVVSLNSADSAAPAGLPEVAAAHAQSADAPSADAPSSGRWIATETVDAQFASTFRSAVRACDGPFQIQLVDAPPQHQIRFRCLPR